MTALLTSPSIAPAWARKDPSGTYLYRDAAMTDLIAFWRHYRTDGPTPSVRYWHIGRASWKLTWTQF